MLLFTSGVRDVVQKLREDMTFMAVERSQLLIRRPGTLSWILSGIQRAAQAVLGVYSKRSCSRDTGASSALAGINDYALYKSELSMGLVDPWVGLDPL